MTGYVLGARGRWTDTDEAGRQVSTARRESEEQRSQRQALIWVVSGPVPCAITLTARSTASKHIYNALTLANKASTRALYTPIGVGAPLPTTLPPTYSWRLRWIADSTTMPGNAAKKIGPWKTRDAVPSYAGSFAVLAEIMASGEHYQQARLLWSTVGKVWAESWSEAAEDAAAEQGTGQGAAPAVTPEAPHIERDRAHYKATLEAMDRALASATTEEARAALRTERVALMQDAIAAGVF